MEDTPTVLGEARSEPAVVPPKPRPSRLAVLSFVVGLVGVAAIGAAGWVYTQTQRDITRLSTDIAQIRLSLALFNQQQAALPADTTDASATIEALSNRLAILEENWRDTPPAAPATAVLPSIGGDVPTAAAGEDCLPTGTRFMVTAGDSYPVCGTTGSVAIAAVDNGFITLSDGTVIAQGGTVALPGTACMVGVLPSDGGTISGFAEIRVAC